jgi:hypothetical protein
VLQLCAKFIQQFFTLRILTDKIGDYDPLIDDVRLLNNPVFCAISLGRLPGFLCFQQSVLYRDASSPTINYFSQEVSEFKCGHFPRKHFFLNLIVYSLKIIHC